MSEQKVKGLVSIVVASYNHARFLPRRMESLISQTYDNIEILVIDDCSPDNSWEILQQYASHPKVTLIKRKENGGWITVSNQGIEIANGEFIIFANCDDDCEPDMVARLVNGMEQGERIGVSFCRSKMIDENNSVLGDDFAVREKSFRASCSSDTLIDGAKMTRFLLHSCVIPNLSAALIRKEALDEHGYFSKDYKACCDWELFFRIFRNYSCYYVAEPLNLFRQHNKTIRSSLKGRIEYEEFFRLLLSQIKLIDMTTAERVHYRTAVMKLWSVYLFSPGLKGFRNFRYHFNVIRTHDAASLFFLAPGIGLRFVDLFTKALKINN